MIAHGGMEEQCKLSRIDIERVGVVTAFMSWLAGGLGHLMKEESLAFDRKEAEPAPVRRQRKPKFTWEEGAEPKPKQVMAEATPAPPVGFINTYSLDGIDRSTISSEDDTWSSLWKAGTITEEMMAEASRVLLKAGATMSMRPPTVVEDVVKALEESIWSGDDKPALSLMTARGGSLDSVAHDLGAPPRRRLDKGRRETDVEFRNRLKSWKATR